MGTGLWFRVHYVRMQYHMHGVGFVVLSTYVGMQYHVHGTGLRYPLHCVAFVRL